jgi:hypothetical protein
MIWRLRRDNQTAHAMVTAAHATHKAGGSMRRSKVKISLAWSGRSNALKPYAPDC